MIKKISLIAIFAIAACLCFSSFSSAQVKKAPVKKTTVTATSKKTTTVRKPVVKPAASTKMLADASTKVKIWTDSGTMIVKLYDSTPLHRDNFVRLVNQGFYDSLLFHRVISTFMIQGGDPLSKNAPAGQMLGNGGSDMQRIPAEFRQSYFHKRGALAAARDGNPEKASSACQFYIVQGKLYKDNELDMVEAQMGRKFTPEERTAYKTVGGTPFLDQNYTVFGEVISGFDVIDKIANAPKAPGDRPLTDIHMKMEVVK
jgi:cyclophilin family peptidyl-prolyl cis-trans isomerase